MKKILIILLVLILCSCSKKEIVKQQTISELTNKFTYTNGVCLRDDVDILFSSLNRGDKVTIIDENDDFYFISNGSLVLKVQKKYIRTELDNPFEEYRAYTRAGSHLYSEINGNDIIETFSLNKEVMVIDEFDGMLLVELNGVKGYMYPSQTSRSLIPIYVAPTLPESNESYETSGSSSGGGDSGGGGGSPDPVPAPPVIPESHGDGEDISIYNIPKHKVYYMAYSNKLNGTVLMDNTKVYLSTINRNEEVNILSETDDKYIILIDGYQGTIEKKYVRKENEAKYEPFNGYTVSGASIYFDFEMNKIISIFGINETVKIIDEVDGVYIVELDNGDIGYMKKSNISKDKIYIAPRVEAPVEEPVYDTPSSGGGSSNNDEGGGSPEPTPAPSEWTPEAL